MKRSIASGPTWATITAGLLVALAAYFYLMLLERELSGGPRHAVLALRRDVALGQRVTAADLEQRELPERYLEERHVLAKDRSRVEGARATATLSGGACLLWSDLDTARGKTLASLLSSGMRAFALSGAGLAFAGLLRAGDHVDVLFTRGDDGQARTSTLLQNLVVLSVGTTLASGEAEVAAESVAAELVTLGVSAEQAPLLAHAASEGELRLSLRHPRDAVIAEGLRPATDTDLTMKGALDDTP